MATPQQAQQAHEAMAASIMAELQKLGAWVVNPQPLRDERMRFEVLNDQVPQVLDKLLSWGWSPRPCSAGSRFVPSGNSALAQPTSIYELEMPRDKEAPKPKGAEVIDPEEWRKMLEGFKGFKR